MVAVRTSPVGAGTFASPQALRATLAAGRTASPAAAAQGSILGLAQDLFQQVLQATTTTAAPGTQAQGSLGPTTVPSLLAALNPPQATSPAPATATPSAPTPSTVSVPATQALDGTTAASAAVTQVVNGPAVPDATGATLDFALQTALRFGAGVGPLGVPPTQVPNLSEGPVRDAISVLRAGPLQARAGGPGPEAFARSPFAQEAVRAYQGSAAPPPLPASEPAHLDLLA